ncbi:MAG: serine/threonine protein kinase [Phycisphaerales bacterium]|nr:serine/threonine protein kinase [Phycisphaerales bacterium]
MTADDKKTSEKRGDQFDLVAAAWRQVAPLWSATGCDSKADTVIMAAPTQTPLPGVSAHEFPGYRVMAELQRGGQGVVYHAIQESTQRDVAIKVMRDGPFAGPRERARFEREVQILAQLKHPNIVTIHDSGVTGHAAYFVMDYIAGFTLDGYVERRNPGVRDRLKLFVKICDAVNVAHLRGVIHRDLKPGNLRVDDAGEPHVLDFGLAKRFAGEETKSGSEAMTVTGQFVGSLPWSSPEQAAGKIDQIDLRTDVYSLGVILYQLLTGEFPYEVSGSLGEAAHNIVHRDAQHPRLRNRKLDDEICTIVLKALRKDRDERYQTAGALGRDVERYLRGEAIEAKRDSTTYLLRKHLARHKFAASVAAGFVLLVTAGFFVSLSFWRQAVLARNAEADQARLASSNAQMAERRAEQAAAEAAKAEAVSDFLTGMLATASPSRGGTVDMTVRDAVDIASKRIDDGAFDDQPDVEGAVRRVIGSTYNSLGQYERAKLHLEKALELQRQALGESHLHTLMCAFEVADARGNLDDLDGAESLFRETLDIARSAHGDDHLIVAMGLNGLADVMRDRDKLAEAEEYNRESLAILEALPDTKPEDLATTLNDLALVLDRRAKSTEALATLERAHKLFVEAYGPHHRSVAVSLSNIASSYAARGDFDRAIPLLDESVKIFRETVGEHHPDIASAQDLLGRLYLRQGDYRKAEETLRASLDLRVELLGPDHALVAHSLNNLAIAQYQLGDLAGAEDCYARALDILRKTRGDDHPSIAVMMNNLAAVRRARGDLAGSISLLREALVMRRAHLGESHPAVGEAYHNLGRALLDAGELDDAEENLRASLHIREATYNDDHESIASTLDALAELLRMRGDLETSADYAYRSLAMRRRVNGEKHPDVADSLETCGRVEFARGDNAKAVELLSQSLAIRESALPPGHSQIGVAQSELGAAQTAAGDYESAEKSLHAGYDILTKNHGDGDKRTQSTIQRLVTLYEATGNTDQATNWRSKLSASPAEPIDDASPANPSETPPD